MSEERLVLAFPIVRKMDDGDRVKHHEPEQGRTPPDNKHRRRRTQISSDRRQLSLWRDAAHRCDVECPVRETENESQNAGKTGSPGSAENCRVCAQSYDCERDAYPAITLK